MRERLQVGTATRSTRRILHSFLVLLEIPSLTLTIGSRNLEKIHRSDVLTVAGDAGGGVDPLCAGGGRLLPHPGLAAPDAGHGGRDLGAPGGFLMVVCTLA